MADVHFATIPCEPNTANEQTETHIFTKFVSVLKTMCMPGLKFLELFRAFL